MRLIQNYFFHSHTCNTQTKKQRISLTIYDKQYGILFHSWWWWFPWNYLQSKWWLLALFLKREREERTKRINNKTKRTRNRTWKLTKWKFWTPTARWHRLDADAPPSCGEAIQKFKNVKTQFTMLCMFKSLWWSFRLHSGVSVNCKHWIYDNVKEISATDYLVRSKKVLLNFAHSHLNCLALELMTFQMQWLEGIWIFQCSLWALLNMSSDFMRSIFSHDHFCGWISCELIENCVMWMRLGLI